MKVLIVGGGGREHALAWKASKSPLVKKVFVAPGNAGTAHENNIENIDIDAENVAALLEFARTNAIDLTIVGPEAALVKGIVDEFNNAGLKIFGPTQAAAQLEGSKAFSKDFLSRHKIPTAFYQHFTDEDEAIAYIEKKGAPLVIKADGLAAGKGVIIAQSNEEAITAVKDMLSGNSFGNAGARVVIEELLIGEEASFICMIDGHNILPLASSQDHKARDDGDNGPNTGGMGAYSPAPVVTTEMHKRIIDEVIRPTVDGMASEGNIFTGFLYAGVMIGSDGIPKVLEFNVRMGDPETQPILMRLQSDIIAHCLQAIDGQLDRAEAIWDERTALGVVLAAGGYPYSYQKGDIISGLDNSETDSRKVFHAGTVEVDNNIQTNGGRVLCAVGLGSSVTQAQTTAYELVNTLTWKDVYFRKDIGYRAINREIN